MRFNTMSAIVLNILVELVAAVACKSIGTKRPQHGPTPKDRCAVTVQQLSCTTLQPDELLAVLEHEHWDRRIAFSHLEIKPNYLMLELEPNTACELKIAPTKIPPKIGQHVRCHFFGHLKVNLLVSSVFLLKPGIIPCGARQEPGWFVWQPLQRDPPGGLRCFFLFVQRVQQNQQDQQDQQRSTEPTEPTWQPRSTGPTWPKISHPPLPPHSICWCLFGDETYP